MKRLTKEQYEFLARQIKGGQVYHDDQYINTTSFVYSLMTNFAILDKEFNPEKFVEQCGLILEKGYPKIKAN